MQSVSPGQLCGALNGKWHPLDPLPKSAPVSGFIFQLECTPVRYAELFLWFAFIDRPHWEERDAHQGVFFPSLAFYEILFCSCSMFLVIFSDPVPFSFYASHHQPVAFQYWTFPNFRHSDQVFRYLLKFSFVSHFAQIFTPSGLRASYITFTETVVSSRIHIYHSKVLYVPTGINKQENLKLV